MKRYKVFKRFDSQGNHKYVLSIPLKVQLDLSNGHKASSWGRFVYVADLMARYDNIGKGRAA